ncbi:hypothetical protein ASPZODRAFT_21611 [Penicilliopsis zonata CBS 506.65]|uniref:Uncharacterized protein n=1 Tax=Penicilliopsis zonata CBS 506.65 TaxID=1073090 RepID=A0A1L9SV57_9EURO|nr:hypothetical protein ASPZODRAFT_21611 [Penicilliopsis zonata CBS 506.65]OJJ51110.1 hypothetical protein ASPZODRAFT_21611 [Penicilliopsis zonata CBS 506.65]
MESSGQNKQRAHLRVVYDQAVSTLIKTLNSQPKEAYSQDELTRMGVSLAEFNPEDPKFLDSKASLFKPLSVEELAKYTLDESELAGPDTETCYFDFDGLYDHPTISKDPPYSYILAERADHIFQYLNILYIFIKAKKDGDLIWFNEEFGWLDIRDGNSFLNGPQGLLLGLRKKVPPWDTLCKREWQDDAEDPTTLRPHIMLIVCTGAETSNDELLYGELGPIAQTIQNRLNQTEFENTSLFPVLVLSLFGPRHGRILQAKYNKSGVLKVHASPIYSFRFKATSPFDLFLRYQACEACHGPEYEFDSDEEDVPIQASAYASPSLGADKENAPPKEDDAPSPEQL